MIRRKALIVCPAGIVAGKEIVSLALARGLRDHGFDLEVITSTWGNGELSLRLAEEDFKYYRFRLGFISVSLRWHQLKMTFTQLWHWPSLLYRYACLIRRLAPEVVIHTNWHHALLLLPLLDPQRDIYWAHELASQSRHMCRVYRSIARRVGRVICVSRAVAVSMRDAGVPDSRIAIVHNGIASTTVLPFSPGGVPLRLGIVGQIGCWKGHDDMFEALGILSRKGMPFKLRIFGTGSAAYIDKLKVKASGLGISNNIEWCGFVRDQAEMYELIDVCVVPSRFDEPFGMSALEACSFGRPVICSSRGGLREIVEPGVTGLLVESKRPDQLADAILKFLQNRDLVMEMGKAARNRVQDKFSQARLVRQFIDIFDEISQAKPQRG